VQSTLSLAVELVGWQELGLYKPNIKGVALIVQLPTTSTPTIIDAEFINAKTGLLQNNKKRKKEKYLDKKRTINPLLPTDEHHC
jgi:hypothetical protein